MASLGTLLKKEREKQKISLDDISEETKIGKKYLSAIETDNYTIFPGETYFIGFIRNYARAIGLDPSDVINQYKAMNIGTGTEAPKTEDVKEEIEPIIKDVKKQAGKKKIKKEPEKEEDFEVVELMEELPENKKKKKAGPVGIPSLKHGPKLFKFPLKERKMINIAHLIIGAGAILVLVILFFIIRFIVSSFSGQDEGKIISNLVEVKRLEFTGSVLNSPFFPNEYYEIKLGGKTYNILFEKLTELSDAAPEAEKNKPLEFAFHIDDITVPLKIKEEKLIDFDYDTQNDLKVKVISFNNDFINARIDKLHAFITASSNNMDAASATNTDARSVKKKRPKLEGFGIKDKIIFQATVKKWKSYVRAWIDGVEQEGNIYYPGQKIELEAYDAIQLQIGNAGALDVIINNKPTVLGKDGEIVNKIIKWERNPYDESEYRLILKDWR